jgi:hypothetical protein
MRERADKIGARFKMRSRASVGTEVELTIPGRIAFEAHSPGLFAMLYLRRTGTKDTEAKKEGK